MQEVVGRIVGLTGHLCRLSGCVKFAGFAKNLHDYGTGVLMRTGNLAAVMSTTGHRDVKTAMHYQHPEFEIVALRSISVNRHLRVGVANRVTTPFATHEISALTNEC